MSKKRITVVDDDVQWTQALRGLLECKFNVEIEVFDDISDARESIRSHVPDFLVVDGFTSGHWRRCDERITDGIMRWSSIKRNKTKVLIMDSGVKGRARGDSRKFRVDRFGVVDLLDEMLDDRRTCAD